MRLIAPLLLLLLPLGAPAADTPVHACLRTHAPAAWRQPLVGQAETNWTSLEEFRKENTEGGTFLGFLLSLCDRAEEDFPLASDGAIAGRFEWEVPAAAVRVLLAGRGVGGGVSGNTVPGRAGRVGSLDKRNDAFLSPTRRILHQYDVSQLAALCEPSLPRAGMGPTLYGLKYDREAFQQRCADVRGGGQGDVCGALDALVGAAVVDEESSESVRAALDEPALGRCDADSSRAELLRLRLKQLMLHQRYYDAPGRAWHRLAAGKQCRFGQQKGENEGAGEKNAGTTADADPDATFSYLSSVETAEGDEGRGWRELPHGTVTAALGANYTRVPSSASPSGEGELEPDRSLSSCTTTACHDSEADQGLPCADGLVCGTDPTALRNLGMGVGCTPPPAGLGGGGGAAVSEPDASTTRCYDQIVASTPTPDAVIPPSRYGAPSRTHFAVHTADPAAAYRLVPGEPGNLWEHVDVRNGFFTAEKAFDDRDAADGHVHSGTFNGTTSPRGYTPGARLWDVTPLFPRQPFDLRTSVGVPGLTLRECASLCALVGDDCTGFGVYDRRTKAQAVNGGIASVLASHFGEANGGIATDPRGNPGATEFFFGSIFTANLPDVVGTAGAEGSTTAATEFDECHMFQGRPRDAVATARGGAQDESSWTESEPRGHLTAPAGTIFVDRLWIPGRVGAGPGWNGGWSVNDTRTIISAEEDSDGLVVTSWGTAFALGRDSSDASPYLAPVLNFTATKKQHAGRAHVLVRAALENAQMPINYGIMGLSVVSPIGMPGYYATGLSGLDLLPDDMTAARGPSAYRRFHLSYCNANRDDGGDGSSSPAERLDKCAEECAHLVAKHRHLCTSGMWKEPGSLPNSPKTWSAPLPAVGVDSGYPLQDWITFFVGLGTETRPAKCQCVRASGRRFGQEQTYNGDVLNHLEVLWEYDERGLESTNPFFKYKQQESASDGYIGCYLDDRSRDFNYGPREYGYDVDTCRAACTSYEYFALENNGWCSCDNSYSTPPSQYPRRADRDCGKTRKGGAWANAVFAQAPGLRRTAWVESAKSAIYGIPGLLNLTQTYGSAVNATNAAPSLPLVAQHGFGGQAPRIRAVRFLAASDIGSGEQTEAEALSARLHWSAAGAALRSSLGNSHVVDPARRRISSRGSVGNDQPGAPRRRRCHPHLFPTPAATGKMMGTSSSTTTTAYEYVAYADTDCAQAPHRERDEGIIPEVAGQTSADAKVQCDGDPTCRAVACRSDGACFLSAAVRFSAMDGMTCFVRTAVEKATAATAAATEALAADPTGEKTLWASAEDAFSTCNVVPAGAGTGSSYGEGGAGIKPITEEVALGKLRNGSCSWVPLQDVGGTTFGAANGSALSCADAMRDIYDDACFATVYAELLSSSQRRAVCANMGGAGGAGASGCGFARPDCDYGE